MSGRGVGMDVVRKAVSGLGGMLALQTTAGRGTCFTLHIPLTLAIVDALIVSVGGQTFAVPLPLVREVVRIDTDQVTRLAQQELMWHRGNALPLIALNHRFGLPTTPSAIRYAFVAGNGAHTVGIVVDQLQGKREIVVRPLADPLAQTPGIAGATELGDGRPVLILDVAGLMQQG